MAGRGKAREAAVREGASASGDRGSAHAPAALLVPCILTRITRKDIRCAMSPINRKMFMVEGREALGELLKAREKRASVTRD